MSQTYEVKQEVIYYQGTPMTQEEEKEYKKMVLSEQKQNLLADCVRALEFELEDSKYMNRGRGTIYIDFENGMKKSSGHTKKD